MKAARWRALGHMLRRDEKTPCQRAMEFYFEIPREGKKFSGRKRCTLPVRINEDIKSASAEIPITTFDKIEDLRILKNIAQNREDWRNLSKLICGTAEGNPCLQRKAETALEEEEEEEFKVLATIMFL